MHTVDHVVRAHQSPRRGLADSNLERLKIYLTEWAFRNDSVVSLTLCLLLVADEVLDGRSNILALKTTHTRSSKLPCEVWVFGVGFKIPSTERRAVHADRRCKENIGAAGFGFFSQMPANLFHHVQIPCRSHGDSTWK